MGFGRFRLGQREIGRAFGEGPHAVSKAIVRTAALKREGGKVGRVLEHLTRAGTAVNGACRSPYVMGADVAH